MKYSIIFTTVITLALTSQVVTAGSIADTYATGDTLTATKMENIKTAVNDNDGNIITNTNGITANDSDIANNDIDIGANAGNISSNTDNIDANAIGISDNTNEIGINTLGIADNALNIATASRFYGDGSAGDLVISADTDWTTTSPPNLFFNNVTIDATTTLTVPSGTTIYCAGTFINNGLILVESNNNRSGLFNGGSNLRTTTPATIRLHLTIRNPDIGDAASSATNGSWSPNSESSFSGGRGGSAMQEAAIRSSIGRMYRGGGAGGGGSNTGGSGGGALRVLCKGDISNNGEIRANGNNAGSGGGGGGIIVLASPTSVQHLGTGALTANGGNGGNAIVYSNLLRGAAGGGGGGIVALIAPTLVNVGAINVDGGTGGVGTTLTNDSDRMSGGGGGASGGNGGSGGFMNPGTSATAFAGTDGSLGITVLIAASPEALF